MRDLAIIETILRNRYHFFVEIRDAIDTKSKVRAMIISSVLFLALYADLAVAKAKPLLAVATGSRVRIVERMLPRRLRDRVRAGLPIEHHPGIRVELGADSRNVEYSYRQDGAPWSLWTSSQIVEVRGPQLLFEGRHLIEARARLTGMPDSIDRKPARTWFLVDYTAPTIKAAEASDGLRVELKDNLHRPGELALEYRLKGPSGFGRWHDLSTDAQGRARLPRSILAGFNAIEVRANDPAGNTSSRVLALTSDGGAAQAPATGSSPVVEGCACGPVGEAPLGGAVWMLLLLVAVGVRARRR